ncbi:MAG: hypothetical protein ABJB47_02950 [Actinomycetota bacterium]
MKQVLDYIDQRQAELPDHPFFTLLASGQPVEHLLPFELLSGLDLPDETAAWCCALTDRCHEPFGRLFDSLVELVQSADAGTIRRMRDRASLLRTGAS